MMMVMVVVVAAAVIIIIIRFGHVAEIEFRLLPARLREAVQQGMRE